MKQKLTMLERYIFVLIKKNPGLTTNDIQKIIRERLLAGDPTITKIMMDEMGQIN